MDEQENEVETRASSVNQNDDTPWYQGKQYQRYWRHRSQVSKWFYLELDKHRQQHCLDYYRKMAKYHAAMAKWMRQMETYYTNWYHTWATQIVPSQTDYRPIAGGRGLSNVGLKRKGSKQRRHSDKRQKRNIKQTAKLCRSSDDEQFTMEITADLLDFFRQSAKHKKERDAKKQEREASEVERIDIGDVNAGRNKATMMPPSGRPGLHRTTEMRLLYGKGAAMIHGMETAMQLNYDRNYDLQQPKLWPQLPINIKFT